MSTKVTCPVCCENVHSCKIISCSKCEFGICYKCIVEYTKTLKTIEIKCMNTNCNHIWDRTFICRQLPASIVYGPLKKHREEMLLEKEIATLPATSQLIPMISESKKMQEEMSKIRELIKKYKGILSELELEYYPLLRRITILKNDLEGVGDVLAPVAVKEENEIMCPCPTKDCRGFVFKKTSCCTICNVELCSKCHVVVGAEAEHECNPDDVASVALIKKECKPCPNCGVPSRKTDGCSQVWCIMCHKAWDWKTGKIDEGYVHATDYYNYMRANGLEIPARGAAGGACNRGDPTFCFTYMGRKYPELFTKDEESFLFRRWQLALEYTGNYHREPNNIAFVDLRLKYLNKEIDKKKWKGLLHKRDKEFALFTEIYRMQQAYGRTMHDSILIICDNYNKKESFDVLKENLKLIHRVHEMMVDEFYVVTHAFKSKRVCPFAIRD